MTIGCVLLSCEHGGNRVPRVHAGLFRSRRAHAALASHRGLDIGALAVARALAHALPAELHSADVTRLLIDLNKSLRNRMLFSEFSRRLDPGARRRLIDDYYMPHREGIETAVRRGIVERGVVCHIGVHSFTPVLNGNVRNADIGLLYDSRRKSERDFCQRWKRTLEGTDPALRVRSNYPYLGKADGLTTALRRRFQAREYLGIELEVNQALLTGGPRRLADTIQSIVASVTELLLRPGATNA